MSLTQKLETKEKKRLQLKRLKFLSFPRRFAFQKGNPAEKKFTTIQPKEKATEMGQRKRKLNK